MLQAIVCNVIPISRKSHVPNFQYCLDNNILQHTDKIVDLRVIIDSKLSNRDHVVKTASKAHTVLGMIKRALGYDSPDSVKHQLYLSHVRSVLLLYSSLVTIPRDRNSIIGEGAATCYRIYS